MGNCKNPCRSPPEEPPRPAEAVVNAQFEEEKRNLLLKNEEMQAFINSPSNAKIDIGGSSTYSGGLYESKATGPGTIENEQFTFAGEFLNGRPNGQGTITYRNGTSYTGGLVNGFYHGAGVYSSHRGYVYTGDFNMNRFDGQGTCVWSDGTRYKGGFKLDKFEGPGELSRADGTTFTGNFRNGLKEGPGVLRLPATRAQVEGVWRAGRLGAVERVTVDGAEVPKGLFEGLVGE